MHLILASLIDWGWFRLGPPYIYLNIGREDATKPQTYEKT